MEEEMKKLNMFNIFCLGLGGAIGTGIFVLLGYGIADTGRSIVLVVVLGCLYMLLAYMYNLVMSSMFVFKGGDYSQKALLFNPIFTGVSAVFAVMGGLGFASYALAIVDYIGAIYPVISSYRSLMAVIIMTLFFASSIRGTRFVTIIENIMTIGLVAAIAMFVVCGVPQVNTDFFTNAGGGFFHGGFGGFVAAISIMGWACQGTTMAPISMSAVTKKPKRTIPAAILLITIALAVIYGLISYVAAGVLPYEKAAGANLSATAEAIFSRPMYILFILIGGVFAIATSLIGGIAMMRYPMMKVAEDGWLPAVFKKKTKNGYPWAIMLAFYVLSILPILTGMSIDSITSLIMIPTMLICFYLNIACITLPKRYPKQWKNSIMKMPKPVFVIVMVLSGLCDLIIAYTLFTGLSKKDMLMTVLILAICFAISYIRLKTGAVTKEQLELNKEAIIMEALAEEENEVKYEASYE